MAQEFRKFVPLTDEPQAPEQKASRTNGGGRSFTPVVRSEPEFDESIKRERRALGLPEKEPTFGGTITRGFVKPFVKVTTSLKNIRQAAEGKEQTDFQSPFLGRVPRVGKNFNITKGFTKDNIQALKDSIGTGAEIGSLFIGAPGASTLAKGVTQTGKQAAKQLGKAVALETAGGAVGGFGVGLQEEDTLKGVLKSTAIGTGAGLVLGGGLLGLGRIAPKLRPVVKKMIEGETEVLEDIGEIVMRDRVGADLSSTRVGDKKKFKETFKTSEEFISESEKALTKTTRASKRLKEQVIANDIDIEFGELPQYRTVSLEDQAKKANELLESDPARINRILSGAENPPDDILIGSVYNAAKRKALEEADVDSLLRLSKSEASELASVFGQQVKAFDDGLRNTIDIVDVIRKVREVKYNTYTKKTGVNASPAIKRIKKEVPPLVKVEDDAWVSFINNLEC